MVFYHSNREVTNTLSLLLIFKINTHPEVALLTVGWGLPYHLLIKKVPPDLMAAFSQLRFPPLR